MRSDDERALRYVLDVSVGGVGYTVEEVEHTQGLCRIEKLEVENYGASCEKVVCNVAYLIEGSGAYDLELYVAVSIAGVGNHGSGLLLLLDYGSGCGLLVGLELNLVNLTACSCYFFLTSVQVFQN